MRLNKFKTPEQLAITQHFLTSTIVNIFLLH